MTKHELASFALKLLGIYTLIESLPLFQYLGSLTVMLRSNIQGYDGWTGVVMLIPLLLTATAGVVLLAFSRDLAPLLVGKEDKPLGTTTVLTGRDVQAIGFSVVAVLIFLRAMPQISQSLWTALNMMSRNLPNRPGQLLENIWRYFVPAVIQFVLAVILFFQARGLADFWHRIRGGKYAGSENTGTGNSPPIRREL